MLSFPIKKENVVIGRGGGGGGGGDSSNTTKLSAANNTVFLMLCFPNIKETAVIWLQNL